MKRNADQYFEDNTPYVGLGRASLRGGAIALAARCVNVLVQVASTIVLARLLSPHDFGLVAVVLALVGFAPLLIDLGTTDAAVQRSRITHADISTLFWLNFAIGVVMTAVLVLASGFIAAFFAEPALAGIVLVSSLTLAMTAGMIQHYALMRRAMQFQRIALIDMSANVLSAIVAIAMALSGWGYWALVARPLLTSGFTAVGAWLSCPWWPGPPRSSEAAGQMVRFGLGITGFTATDYLTRSLDRLALGYFHGAGNLGYFQTAFLLYSNLLGLVSEPPHNIAVSALSKLKENLVEFRRAWTAAISAAAFYSIPAFAVLAVTSQDLVVILLGAKWAPAGPLLCIFAVRGIANCTERTLGWLHVSAGRTDRWMRWGVFSAFCQLAALCAGLPFGPIGVAVAYMIVMFMLFVPALVYAGNPVGIGRKEVLSAVGPQTMAGLVAFAVGFALQSLLLSDLSHLSRFVLSIGICSATYLAVAVGIFHVTEPLRLAFILFRDLVLNGRGADSNLTGKDMRKSMEAFLVKLDSWPLSAVLRVALGLAMLPLLRALSWGHDSLWLIAGLFIAVLVAMRIGFAVLRRIIPYSAESRQAWWKRRGIAKEHDSFFWQKQFWIGLGMLPYAFIGGGLRSSELILVCLCLIAGGAGLLFWRRARASVSVTA